MKTGLNRFRFPLLFTTLLIERLFMNVLVIVPTFVTKVTECLCSGGFFFLRQISTF